MCECLYHDANTTDYERIDKYGNAGDSDRWCGVPWRLDGAPKPAKTPVKALWGEREQAKGRYDLGIRSRPKEGPC